MPERTLDALEADDIQVVWALTHDEIESIDEYEACVRVATKTTDIATLQRLLDLIVAWEEANA